MKIRKAVLSLLVAGALLTGMASVTGAWTYDTQVIEYEGNSNIIGTRPGTIYSCRVGVIINNSSRLQDLKVELNYHDGFVGQYFYSIDGGTEWLEVAKDNEYLALTDVLPGQEVWLRAVTVYYRYLSSSPWGEADESIGDEYYFAFPPGGRYYENGTTNVNKTGFVAVAKEIIEPPVETVISAGQEWMDRNLGAEQVATSSADEAAYGDLYQWGRLADGHESRTSPVTSTLSEIDIPGHDSFITTMENLSRDWRTPQNDDLWQGVSGINNPCPCGFRLPTAQELNIERYSWETLDAAGAFASPTKIVAAGSRSNSTGTVTGEGGIGHYWSSTVYEDMSWDLAFHSKQTYLDKTYRGNGYSIRCIKD